MAPITGEYIFSSNDEFKLTDEMKKDFENHGYVLIRGLLTTDEMTLLKKELEDHKELTMAAYGINDGSERNSKLVIWSHPGSDVSGIIARSEKVARTSQQLLGGEVYHYHSKLIMKEARTGGSFVWHQDYGYWYKNGNLFSDLLTVYLAIDHQDSSNGGMQIMPGSQKAGRVDHNEVGGQQGADLERVEQLKKMFDVIQLDLDPGDVLFFHSNVLHKSNQNQSDTRRYALTMSYNLKSNNPVYVHHHPQYTPLDIVPNSAILDCTNFTDMTGKEFLDPRIDKTVSATLPKDFRTDAKSK